MGRLAVGVAVLAAMVVLDGCRGIPIPCEDDDEQENSCQTWHLKKQCRLPDFVKFTAKLCRKTCGFCDTEEEDGIARVATTDQPTTKRPECKDIDELERCRKKKKEGKCLSCASTKIVCRKTCGLCNQTKKCEDIAKTSECSGHLKTCHQDDMKRLCAKTCGVCGPDKDRKCILKKPHHGTLTPDKCNRPVTQGTVCQIGCSSGYDLGARGVNSISVSCVFGGVWDLQINAKCILTTVTGAKCNGLTAPANGMVTPEQVCTKEVKPGVICTVKCDSGYELSWGEDSIDMMCTNGFWRNKPFDMICQPKESKCENDNLARCESAKRRCYESGSTGTEIRTKSCRKACGVCGSAKNLKCGISPQRGIKTVTPEQCTQPVKQGQPCTVMCKQGFELVGHQGETSVTATCGDRGIWSEPINAECGPTTRTYPKCPTPPIPDHATVTPEDICNRPVKHTWTCTVSCNEGYELVGQNGKVSIREHCGKHAEWNELSNVTCAKVACRNASEKQCAHKYMCETDPVTKKKCPKLCGVCT